MNNDENQKEPGHRDWYILYLLQEMGKSYEAYDKAMLTVTGGSLVLTITFIRRSAGEVECACLLLISWIVLLVCLGAIVISHLTAQSAWRRTYDIEIGTTDNTGNPWDMATLCFNIASAALLCIGLVLLTIFGYINIS